MLDDKTVLTMRRLVRNGMTYQQAADQFGVPMTTAAGAISGRHYKHLGGAVKRTLRAFAKYQVKEMRRLWEKENWTQPALAAYFGCAATTVSSIVTGRSYQDIPGGTKKPLGKLSDETVIEMRRLYRDENVLQTELSRRFGTGKAMTGAIVTGRLYKHLPGATIKPHPGRGFTDEQVLFMRLLYQTGLSLKKIGEPHGSDPATIGAIVRGKTYAHVPEATPLRPSGKPRKLTEEQVIQARRMYRTRYVAGTDIGKEFGIGDAIYAVIRGNSYKDIPGRVPMHVTTIRRGISTRSSRKKREPQAASS